MFCRKVIISAGLLCSMSAAAYAAEYRPHPDAAAIANERVESALEQLVAKSSPHEATEGVATYYAKRFEGRRTASGEVYHPDKLTAAHYTLPLGTIVRVINPANNKDVQVRINDRCAPKRFPFIDLSRAAAKKIGLWGKGKIKVVIIPLSQEPSDADAPT
ncbi:MAG TPA: septal ring lytic transglycosylase RlpA family protein [Deltaproteobacteria bacterium]|nr:septal ring lytic transglycosylase RlpA family protein [Deltaproteobacteria bacterium]HQB39070.1 septal ring lytic transglycosylase RlpA family protein [Deltaproteobacteria bacterium]